MPTKKSSSRKPRRTRRKKSAKLTRIALFTGGFLLVLFIGVYGLHLLTDKVPSPGITQSQLDGAIESADSNLRAAYFDMGVSSEQVRYGKPQNKAADNINWEFQDIVINTPVKLSPKEVKDRLRDSFADVPGLEGEFKEGKDSMTALLTINDLETHKIKFNFKEPLSTQKTVKKGASERTKKVQDEDEDKKTAKLKEHIEEYKSKAAAKPKVVIIVDDIGMSKSSVDKLLQIQAPITFAVLPNLPHSEYAANEAHKKGREVMLHLPMEPKESSGYTAVDAGEDALVLGLPKSEIQRRIDKNLSSIPHIQGVNNHMGSKFMESEELLELVMEEIKAKDLYFIDSMTSGASMGSRAASKYGVRSAERDIFLDDASKGSSYVKSQLRHLIKVSQKKGYAIGICHPYPDTIKALSEMIPEMQEEVEIASVSTLLDHSLQIGKK